MSFVKKDKLEEVVKSITALTSKKVLIGIPGENAERNDGSEMNNPTLGYIHEFGSPANNIPARPFLNPGVKDSKNEWLIRLKKAAEAALNGDKSKVEMEMMDAGSIASTASKLIITSGVLQPLADSTLKARSRKGDKGAIAELASRASGNSPGTDLAKPLIDTSGLLNSITYVIRKTK